MNELRKVAFDQRCGSTGNAQKDTSHENPSLGTTKNTIIIIPLITNIVFLFTKQLSFSELIALAYSLFDDNGTQKKKKGFHEIRRKCREEKGREELSSYCH